MWRVKLILTGQMNGRWGWEETHQRLSLGEGTGMAQRKLEMRAGPREDPSLGREERTGRGSTKNE